MKREMLIVPYDPTWKEQFETIRCQLQELLKGTFSELKYQQEPFFF